MVYSNEIISGEIDHESGKNDEKMGENILRVVSYEDVLSEIGFGRAQVVVLIAMIFVLINVFNETMGISNVLPAAVCDLNLTSSTKGLLTSMTFFGIMVSSYAWGYLGDVRGRRWVIMWTLLFSTIFTVVSVFVSNFALFLACRFMTGFFVAGYSGVLYAYIGEFNVGKHRAAMISWISVAIGISTTIMPLIAMWLLSYDWHFELYPGYEFKPWRLCLLTFALPGVIAAIFMLRLPESPRFLLSVNRNDEALEAVRWIYRTNKGNLDGFDVEQLKPETNPYSGGSIKGIKQLLVSIKNQTLPLLRPPYVLYFSVLCTLQFGTFWIAGGMSLFLPDILNRLLQTREKYGRDFTVCEVEDLTDSSSGNFSTRALDHYSIKDECNDDVNVAMFNDILYLGIAYIVGFIIVALVIRPSRRRAIIAGSFLLSAISGIVIPFVYPRYLIVLLFCSFILFSGINVSLVNGAAVDIFPTNLRSMAVSLGMLFGRFGSTASANVIGNIIDDYCEATYFFSAGVVLVCFMVSFLITK